MSTGLSASTFTPRSIFKTGQTRMIEALAIAAAATIKLLESIAARSSVLVRVHVFRANARTRPPRSNLQMLGFVTDDDLAAVYRKAFCFAFPSLTERFGLPALEAVALVCPVVASNTASLPEVCGDAALFADPKSPRGWLGEIERLHAEPDLGRDLRAKGARQAGRFSWKTSVQAYLDLIASLFPGAAPEQKGEVDPSMQSAKALHGGTAS